eukprot:jgi/Tetstr1/438039/TSEL_026665.t1
MSSRRDEAAASPLPPLLEGAPLSRLATGSVLGVAPLRGAAGVLVTVGGYGVQLVDTATTAIKSSWTTETLELTGPALLDDRSGQALVPLRPTAAPSSAPDSLVAWLPNAPSGRLDGLPRVALPGRVAAMHPLGGGGTVLLYRDGSAGLLAPAASADNKLATEPIPASAGKPPAGPPLASAALSNGSVAYVLGSRLWLIAPTPGGASAAEAWGGSRPLAPPAAAPSARPAALAGLPGRLVLLWSDGTWQVLRLADGAVLLERQLRGLVSAEAGSSGAAATPSGKKRRQRGGSSGDGAPPRGSPALVALSEQHVAVMGWGPPGSRALLGLLDGEHGCAAGLFRLPHGEPPADSAARVLHCARVGGRSTACVIATGSSAMVAELEIAPLSLASLVGCLAPGAAINRSASAAAEGLFGREGVAALAAPLRASHRSPLWASAETEEDGGGDGGDGGGDAAEASAVEDPESLWDLPGMEAAEAAEASLATALAAPAGPPADVAAMLRTLLSDGALGNASPGLVTAAAGRLAAAGEWALLRQLLAAHPLESLALAEELPAALLQGQQYELLALLLPRARDIHHSQTAAILAALVAEEGARMEDVRTAQAAYADGLRRAAERYVAAAEEAAPGEQRVTAITAAGIAADATDGFSDSEVCLHPLLRAAHSSVALAAALQRLPIGGVVLLLGYLERWLQVLRRRRRRYRTLPEGTPPGMIHPSRHQVVMWISATLDCHLTGLIHSKAGSQVAQRLSASVQAEVRDMKALLALEGAAQHLLSKSPLPSPKNITSKLYSLELLDTRVK